MVGPMIDLSISPAARARSGPMAPFLLVRAGDGEGWPVSLPAPCVGVTVGYQHACAWTAAGELFCWGGNLDGQLGDGTTMQRK